MRSAPDIDFEYSPSPRVRLAVGVMTLVAVGCVAASGLQGAVRVTLAVLAVAGWLTWRPLRGPLQVAWDGDGRWSVVAPGCGRQHAKLAGHARFAGVVVLRLALPGGTHTLLLTASDLPADTWRHLRIRLAGQRPG
ncbi:MAG TPA: hypothetical protein VK519_03935 [Pinirhizobacter sp.]|uniref:hypothetical protein n=1 Tax=Pinirhizobacter sp. TaxID=2950432 RepID=UPI002B7CC147|nr:hypothetical protein [Pinirhizobacter sp.]HMH67051.1 hypothetical protein [Pinirhizobacter sp.]